MGQIGKLYGLMGEQASRLSTYLRLWKPRSRGGKS